MQYSGARAKPASGAFVPVVWYLLNLLLAPIVGFAVLLWMHLSSAGVNELRRAHAKAAVIMSLIGFVLIGSGVFVGWVLFGDTGHFLTFALVWAISLHTGFVLWGMISLAQAMSDKKPVFPARWL